jgi:hypothetical protein
MQVLPKAQLEINFFNLSQRAIVKHLALQTLTMGKI